MGIINPEKALRLMGFDIGKAVNALSAIQSTTSDYASWQTSKKWELFNYHLSNNKFYRSFVGNASVLQWENIPIMKKSDFQCPLKQLITDGFSKNRLYVGNTSGSTGKPFVYAKDKFCHALAWAIIKHRYHNYGIDLNSLQARFYGIPLKGKSALKEQVKDKLMNRVRFPVFDLSLSRLNQFVNKFRQYPFEYMYGYTNAIRHFSQYLIEAGTVLKNICPTLKCVIVTAEMCSSYDRKVIELAAGVPCIIEYGSSETGIIGFEWDGIMRASDELLHLETDSNGSLLITSLFNYAFPMIRYRIGDQVELAVDGNTGTTSIRRIMGRSDDMIVLPNGKVAAGLTMYYISRNLLEQATRIKEVYVTQTQLSSFKIFYVGEYLSEKEVSLVRKSFDVYLQPGLHLEIIKTDAIRRKANGKLQMFHSELTA
jgi:phenylacetate-CoA ligase